MGMQAGGGGGLQSEINVTPMVDVMLVLLIIFMVVTPFLQQGINVAIPRGMKNLNLDDLKSQVEKALANKKEEDKIVYIKSGVEVSYGEVVKVINAVREKGVDKIGLVADKLKKGASAPPPAPAT